MLRYYVVFGFGEGSNGVEVIAQATALADGHADIKTLKAIVAETAEVTSMQVAVFESETWGSEKHPDGKDAYRVHQIVERTQPMNVCCNLIQ